MAKTQTAQPAMEADFVKVQADFTKWMGDFAKSFNGGFANGKLPAVDLDALFAAQRKNFEAFSAVNKIVFDGAKTMMQRQAEIARAAVDAFGKATKEIVAVATPEEKLAKQAEFAKVGYEQAFANVREVAVLAQKTGEEAMELINKRVVANFDEMKHNLAKVVKH